VLTVFSEGSWPLRFVAQVAQGNNKFYRYTPRSDYLFSVDTCPLMMIEIGSEPNGIDCFRMLLQAGLLVRVINSIKKEAHSFVAIDGK